MWRAEVVSEDKEGDVDKETFDGPNPIAVRVEANAWVRKNYGSGKIFAHGARNVYFFKDGDYIIGYVNIFEVNA